MSFKEVKELRTQGKFEEALELAIKEYTNEPTNAWNLKSITWSYYDLIKAINNSANCNQVINHLKNLLALPLPLEDKLFLHDKLAYQIAKLIFALNNGEQTDYFKIDELFELTKMMSLEKKSTSLSVIIKAFVKVGTSWTNYTQFAEQIGFDSFRTEDYIEEEYNGKKTSSLVEKFHNTYAKKLISFANQYNVDKSEVEFKINNYLPILNNLIENYPDFQFLPYFKAKILILLNRNEEVLSTFLPFARKKKNNFWIWELLSDLYSIEDQKKIACYCKALSIKSPEAYLVNTRLNFAKILIKKGLLKEAKFEINQVIKTRNENGWKITNEIIELTNNSWYNEIEGNINNKGFYKKHLSIAESILYEDIEEEIVAIEYVNKDKKIINFIKNKDRKGFFSYKNENIESPQIGDILKIRLMPSDSNYFQFVSLQKDNSLQCEAIKIINGFVKKDENKSFAFIDNIFIDPQTVSKNNLKKNQKIEGKAILTYDKNKKQWSWRLISINQHL